MSGRIEMTSCQKEATSKWSKNERLSFTKAGVDIGEDLEAGGIKTAGKVAIKPTLLKRTVFAITGVVDPGT